MGRSKILFWLFAALFCATAASGEIIWKATPKKTFTASFPVGTTYVSLSPDASYVADFNYEQDDAWYVYVPVDGAQRLIRVPKVWDGAPTGTVLMELGQPDAEGSQEARKSFTPATPLKVDASKQYVIFDAEVENGFEVLRREEDKVVLKMPDYSPVRECAFPEKYFELVMSMGGDSTISVDRDDPEELDQQIDELRASLASTDIPVSTKPEEYVVLIEGAAAVGTGFLMRDGDNVYVYTAFHVIDGMRNPVIRNLDGDVFEPLSLEVSNRRDIARMLVAGNPPALAGYRVPVMGEKLKVCGNSQGRGRVTLLKGKVSGLGDGEVESDAEFTSGNSGSALVADEDGLVLGVASYLEQLADEEDFTVKGTRFAKPRRVAAIIDDGIEWVPTEMSRIASANRKHYEHEEFLRQSIELMGRIQADPSRPVSMEGISLTSLARWANSYNGHLMAMTSRANGVRSDRELRQYVGEFVNSYRSEHEKFRRLCQVREAQIRAMRYYPGTEFQDTLNQRLLEEYEALGVMNDVILDYLKRYYSDTAY